MPLALTGGAFASLLGANAHASTQDQNGQGAAAGGKLEKVLSNVWDGKSYTLPELPYAYDALEPHIDEQTMMLHHDKHHQGYVDGLNSAVKALEEAARSDEVDSARLYGLQRNLSFNYGGHLLHSLFWATMGPGGPGNAEMGGEPVGELKKAIDQAYGSFDSFKSHFAASAGTVKGSGWVMLTFDPVADHVFVKAINEHDSHFGPGQLPILPLDIWEHAFYLKYQNKKAEYIDAWFNVVDWAAADEIYRLYHQLWVGKAEHTEEHGHG